MFRRLIWRIHYLSTSNARIIQPVLRHFTTKEAAWAIQHGSTRRQKASSRFRGVWFYKLTNKWRAYGKGADGARVHLGLFQTEEEAARKRAEHARALGQADEHIAEPEHRPALFAGDGTVRPRAKCTSIYIGVYSITVQIASSGRPLVKLPMDQHFG